MIFKKKRFLNWEDYNRIISGIEHLQSKKFEMGGDTKWIIKKLTNY